VSAIEICKARSKFKIKILLSVRLHRKIQIITPVIIIIIIMLVCHTHRLTYILIIIMIIMMMIITDMYR